MDRLRLSDNDQLKFKRIHNDMDRLRLSELDFNPFSALPLEFPDCFIHELRNFRRYSFAPSSFGIASDSLDNGGCQVRIRTNFSQCRTELILRQCS